jgi:hypothetical protein
MTKRLILAGLLLVVGVSLHLLGRQPSGMPEAEASEEADSNGQATKSGQNESYSIQVAPESVSAGQNTKVQVTIVPMTGYKWNHLFPAKLTLTPDEGIEAEKTEFRFQDKGIIDSSGTGVITLSFGKVTPGLHKLTFQGDFSICNDDHCKIFRKETFHATLQAN